MSDLTLHGLKQTILTLNGAKAKRGKILVVPKMFNNFSKKNLLSTYPRVVPLRYLCDTLASGSEDKFSCPHGNDADVRNQRQ